MSYSSQEDTYSRIPEHLRDLFERSCKNLNVEEQKQLAYVLIEFQGVFSKKDFDLGHFTAIKHKIGTGDAKPIRQPMRRTPKGFQAEEKHLNDMLKAGVSRESSSDWSAAPVLVRKKWGGVLWCIGYSALNKVTTKDAYPLPLISECLDTLSGSNLCSQFDLCARYCQVGLEEKDKHKMAFITKYGLYEYNSMPFGLTGAPATFWRVMNFVLRGFLWSFAFLVFRSFGKHPTSFNQIQNT